MDVLCAYDWPGNVRELKNIVERMMILVSEKIIRPEHVPPAVSQKSRLETSKFSGEAYPDNYKEAKQLFKKKFL